MHSWDDTNKVILQKVQANTRLNFSTIAMELSNNKEMRSYIVSFALIPIFNLLSL